LTATVGAGGAWSVDAAALPDGTYTAQAQQTDAAGNTGLSTTRTFTVDTTPPAATLTSPSHGNSTSTLTPTLRRPAANAAGDSSTVTVKIYAGIDTTGQLVQTLIVTRSGNTWSGEASALADGTYTAQAEQSDAVGNVGLSAANTFVLDGPPVVTVDSPRDA